MYKRIIVLAILLLVALSVLKGVASPNAAHAKVSRPDTAYCNPPAGFCQAIQDWSASDHGSQTVTYVDNPGGSTFNWFKKYIELSNANADVEVGIEKGTGASGSGGSLTWFINYAAPGLTSGGDVGEGTVPSGDYNNTVNFGVSYETSGSHIGLNMWIYADKLQSTICFPCNVGTNSDFASNFTDSRENVLLSDTATSGDKIFGRNFVKNQFYQTSWAYDTTNGTESPGNPIQMFWSIPPTMSASGGDLWYCAYFDGDGKDCTFGS